MSKVANILYMHGDDFAQYAQSLQRACVQIQERDLHLNKIRSKMGPSFTWASADGGFKDYAIAFLNEVISQISRLKNAYMHLDQLEDIVTRLNDRFFPPENMLMAGSSVKALKMKAFLKMLGREVPYDLEIIDDEEQVEFDNYISDFPEDQVVVMDDYIADSDEEKAEHNRDMKVLMSANDFATNIAIENYLLFIAAKNGLVRQHYSGGILQILKNLDSVSDIEIAKVTAIGDGEREALIAKEIKKAAGEFLFESQYSFCDKTYEHLRQGLLYIGFLVKCAAWLGEENFMQAFKVQLGKALYCKADEIAEKAEHIITTQNGFNFEPKTFRSGMERQYKNLVKAQTPEGAKAAISFYKIVYDALKQQAEFYELPVPELGR